jgi:exodeoxyribonuclease VII small subunit
MAEEQGFAQARARLDEIVGQVRKKDTSLEQSLDLLEEGVRLANQCTELVDHSEWRTTADAVEEQAPEAVAGDAPADTQAASPGDASAEQVADASMAAEPQHADGVSGGPDAADTSAEVAQDESDEDYDDIFADES